MQNNDGADPKEQFFFPDEDLEQCPGWQTFSPDSYGNQWPGEQDPVPGTHEMPGDKLYPIDYDPLAGAEDPAFWLEVRCQLELLTLESMTAELPERHTRCTRQALLQVSYQRQSGGTSLSRQILVWAVVILVGGFIAMQVLNWGQVTLDMVLAPVVGPVIGTFVHVEDSPQVCDPTQQADWQHKGYSSYGGGDRYHAWLECNPPQIPSQYIPDGCSMYARSSYDSNWRTKDPEQVQAAWLANAGKAWRTNPDYWKTNPVFSPGGVNRLPYNYNTVFDPAWDISGSPGAPDDSSVIMPQLEKIGKMTGAQLLLCHDSSGQFSFRMLFWYSVHNITWKPDMSLPPWDRQANFEYWGTATMQPVPWWNNLYRTWYATARMPGISGKFDAGAEFYCVEAYQAKDLEDNPPTQMIVWEIALGFTGTAADGSHGCTLTSKGLDG
jgi:hypothetical protein